MKRKRLSKEHKKNISLALKGKPKKPFTKEHRKNISLASKGRKHTEEWKRKMSERVKKLIREGKAPKAIQRCINGETKGKNHPMYGKHHTKESKRKISESLQGHISWNKGLKGRDYLKHFKGGVIWNKNKEYPQFSRENHPNWKGGLSFEPYDRKFNNKFRRAIRKRDNSICMLCGIHQERLSRTLDIHHINYNKLLSMPQNCISLCASCHTKTGWHRKHWVNFFQSLLSEKYSYKYENKEIVLELKGGQKRNDE